MNAPTPTPENRPGYRAALRALSRSWLELTNEEQKAALLILTLLILGILVRYWHVYLS